MSLASPRKRPKQMIPEVVIYTNPRQSASPFSPSKKKAVSNAHFERIRKQAQEKEEEDAALKGLSRLEQIKWRAKKKAQDDEKKRMAFEDSKVSSEGKRGLQQMKEEEEDDDDLPELNAYSLRKDEEIESSPLSPAPSTTRSGRVISSSMTSANGKPSSSYELSRRDRSSVDLLSQESNNSATGSQRSRRVTAKTDSYVFRPSFDPPSERRQRLQVANQSAAVQAKIIGKGSFKSSVTDGKSEMIERMLRDHKRDQKKGYDYETLTRTVEMAKTMQKDQGHSIPSTQDEMMNGDASGSDMGDDDTSSASSEESDVADTATGLKTRRVKFDQALTPQEKEEERKRLVELMGGEDNEGTNDLMDILFDKAKSSQDNGIEPGEEDTTSWSVWQKGRPSFTLEPLLVDAQQSTFAKMLMEAVGLKQEVTLCALLGSAGMIALTNDLLGEPQSNNLRSLVIWLVESSTLKKTGHVSFAALGSLCEILASKNEAISNLVIAHLPRVLVKMGTRVEAIEVSFGNDATSTKGGRRGRRSDESLPALSMRRGERLRVIERVLQVVESLIEGHNSDKAQDDFLNIFLFLLVFSIDKAIGNTSLRISRLLEAVFQQIHLHHPHAKATLSRRLSLLIYIKVASITPFAMLEKMPDLSIHSRLFRQQLAYQVFVPALEVASMDRPIRFEAIAEMLESKDPSINRLLIPKGRLYGQVDADTQILGYILSDVALNTVSNEGIGSKAGPALTRIVRSYNEALKDGKQVNESLKGEDEDVIKDKEQIEGLLRIMEALHDLGGKIQDSKGAFLNRSKVKDQMQRLRLMLQYTLGHYGITSNKTNDPLKQSSMTDWMQKAVG